MVNDALIIGISLQNRKKNSIFFGGWRLREIHIIYIKALAHDSKRKTISEGGYEDIVPIFSELMFYCLETNILENS